MNTFHKLAAVVTGSLVCTTIAVETALGQTYVVSSTIGASPYTSIRPDALLLMSDPADDSLSTRQSLPFEWSFYGKEVTGYRASDNGYLTFDSSETSSNPRNSRLPALDAPRNAIFAFWDSLRLAADAGPWSNEIRAKTFGSPPNRVHVIMWVSVTPSNVPGSGSLSFAVAIHEGGDFDVMQVAGRPGGRTTGTIGAQNDDGTSGTMLPGSPDFPYPSLTASGDDDIIYHFTWAAERVNAAMSLLTVPSTAKIGSAIRPSGRFLNAGVDTITSITVYCQFGSNPIWSRRFDGIHLTGNASMPWTIDSLWTASIPGELTTVTAWVQLDGDEKLGDDTIRSEVLTIYGRTASRRPLVEEFTGAWCGWCPDGALQMDTIAKNLPSAVLVSIHAGSQPDLMKSVIGLELADAYLPAFPQAMINRKLFDGETHVPINRTDLAWQSRAAEEIAEAAPFSLDVTASYDPQSRQIVARVTASCADFVVPDDYRLHVLIVEDEVSGEGQGWDQVNYFSGNALYPNHPFYLLPNPMTEYTHRHVLRGSLTPTWGDSGVVPVRMEADNAYTITESGQLGYDVDPAYARVVAFMSRFGPLLADRLVLNATETSLIPASSPRDGVFLNDVQVTVVPPVSHDLVELRFGLLRPTRLSIALFDVQGTQVIDVPPANVQPGTLTCPIDVSQLPSGVYIIHIATDTNLLTRRVIVR